MKGVAFIPARGGSKRLRDKNIIELAGKPLIYHTIDAVAPCFKEVIVATDSSKIREIAEAHTSKPKVIELPAHTTTDTSTVLESIMHLVQKGYADGFDYLGQFLITCPMRKTEDIEDAIKKLTKFVDGVVSITDYDFPPELGLCLDPDGNLHCTNPALPWLTGNTRSQDHTGIKRPNGAVYLRWTEAFKRSPNFYAGRVASHFMPKSRSLDIDTIEDIQYIEHCLNK